MFGKYTIIAILMLTFCISLLGTIAFNNWLGQLPVDDTNVFTLDTNG